MVTNLLRGLLDFNVPLPAVVRAFRSAYLSKKAEAQYIILELKKRLLDGKQNIFKNLQDVQLLLTHLRQGCQTHLSPV